MVVEVLTGVRHGNAVSDLRVVQVTDCRSLFDMVMRDGQLAHCTEKRVQLDASDMRSSVRAGMLQLEWCPTQHQLADGLMFQ